MNLFKEIQISYHWMKEGKILEEKGNKRGLSPEEE
jgi:hypothetical protein